MEPEVSKPFEDYVSTVKLAATDTEGERIRALNKNGLTVTTDWNYELSTVDNHKRAAAMVEPDADFRIIVVRTTGYIFAIDRKGKQ